MSKPLIEVKDLKVYFKQKSPKLLSFKPGILKAVDQAIYPEKTENGTDVTSQIRLKDGNYEGTANGFRGEIKVEVTVKDQKAEKIRILSYYYIHILGKNQVEIFGIII